MPAYFNLGETQVEKLFGAIAQTYSYYANQAVLQGAISEPEYWSERQEKKMDRFEDLLTRYGHEKDGYADPSYGLQVYVDMLDINLVELPEAFSPFYKYFADEENRVMDDLLIVKSENDYLEVLADFADIARSLAVDASPKAFRHEVGKALVSTVNRHDIRPIVSKYPEFAYRHPTARAARETLYWSTDSGAVDEAQRKVAEIEIVAELLREHVGLNPYTGLVRGVPRRDRNNLVPRNVKPYETKIGEMNGDVRRALWELRREEKDKPPAAPRRRQRPPRAKQVDQKRPVRKQKAPPPIQEPPPLTPRSQAELESVIRDLETPAEVGDAEI
jgi:hypothetical protein